MESINLMLLSVSAAFTVAKVAILAIAVAYAAQGIFHPHGRSTVRVRPVPLPFRSRTPVRN